MELKRDLMVVAAEALRLLIQRGIITEDEFHEANITRYDGIFDLLRGKYIEHENSKSED